MRLSSKISNVSFSLPAKTVPKIAYFSYILPASLFPCTSSSSCFASTGALFRTTKPLLKYSPKVIDHYTHPRNVGKFEDEKTNPNVVTGVMGAPECGDVMKMSLRINPDTTVIEEAKFKTFGCGSAIAASSFATEAIRGKTLAQALQLTNSEIAKELSLPPVKLHCSMLAEETIKAAVEKYLSRRPELKTKVVRNRNNTGTTSTTSATSGSNATGVENTGNSNTALAAGV